MTDWPAWILEVVKREEPNRVDRVLEHLERALADAEYPVTDLQEPQAGRVGIIGGRTAPITDGVLPALFSVLELEKQALADEQERAERAGRAAEELKRTYRRIPKPPPRPQ